MGYRIQYGPDRVKTAASPDGQRAAAAFGAFMVAAAVLFRMAAPEGCERIREILLPEVESVAAFLEDAGLPDAVQAFCRDFFPDIAGQ